MTTLFKRNTLKLAALAVGLAGATMVHAAGNFYFPYDAYEELSGTHATKITTSEKAEPLKIGFSKRSDGYDAFEELSGTHADKSGNVMGVAGKSGPAGEEGSPGQRRGNSVRSDLHKIPGDVADGCSKYLRCSGD
jgi:hypothetical protein